MTSAGMGGPKDDIRWQGGVGVWEGQQKDDVICEHLYKYPCIKNKG